ncbi:MAG: TIGR00730 family Rossman fold protein [Cytophagales bacterium]|nr:MAG: TIGR00730 family Rossman fold protein [Cytophagales bacterium]
MQNETTKKVCVYCASSPLIDEVYFKNTEKLAKLLVQKQVEFVFGGGAKGLMGQLADTVIAEGGKITGIMPHFMRELEWAHEKVQQFHFTQTMHERKQRFLEGIDAIITLPGGCGTLEEVLEVITLKRLGLFDKPIILLSIGDFYKPLEEMLEKCISEKFMTEEHRNIWHFVKEPEEVLQVLGW